MTVEGALGVTNLNGLPGEQSHRKRERLYKERFVLGICSGGLIIPVISVSVFLFFGYHVVTKNYMSSFV